MQYVEWMIRRISSKLAVFSSLPLKKVSKGFMLAEINGTKPAVFCIPLRTTKEGKKSKENNLKEKSHKEYWAS